MSQLHAFMTEELASKRAEPNSGLGKAYQYMLKRWDKLTLFLRVPGAPLENNICERALKMAICHRRNSLFYRTPEGSPRFSTPWLKSDRGAAQKHSWLG